jgi:hypothetical protein
MKMLRAKDLWKQEDERKTAKMQAMRPVLSNLSSQLKTYAIQNPSAPYFVYDVPSFVFGYPLYDHREAVEYVRDALTEQGFQVWITQSLNLVISWIKPHGNGPKLVRPPKAGVDYRPFVYDDSAMDFLRHSMNR